MERLEQLLSDLSKYVFKPNDLMWQDGLLRLDMSEGNLDVKLIQFEFESIEEKEMMRPVENVYPLNLTDEITNNFNEIKKLVSEIEWDTLVLEVTHNGHFIPHYEFEGEEVSYKKSNVVTTEYILTNLHNCLMYNASDNYEYVAIQIEKTEKNESKASYMEALPEEEHVKFIRPGEDVYAQNLTMQIFDENRLGETSQWKKALLVFYKSGKVKYKIIN